MMCFRPRDTDHGRCGIRRRLLICRKSKADDRISRSRRRICFDVCDSTATIFFACCCLSCDLERRSIYDRSFVIPDAKNVNINCCCCWLRTCSLVPLPPLVACYKKGWQKTGLIEILFANSLYKSRLQQQGTINISSGKLVLMVVCIMTIAIWQHFQKGSPSSYLDAIFYPPPRLEWASRDSTRHHKQVVSFRSFFVRNLFLSDLVALPLPPPVDAPFDSFPPCNQVSLRRRRRRRPRP